MAQPFIGEIQIFAGDFAPSGYVFADGGTLEIAQNTALFAVFNTTYGGDGQTTFGIPDMRGRAPMHAGSGPGLTPRQVSIKGGVEEVTLADSNMPAHGHNMFGVLETVESLDPAGKYFALGTTMYDDPVDLVPMAPGIISDAGGGQPHSNIQPQLALSFILAVAGAFPSQ